MLTRMVAVSLNDVRFGLRMIRKHGALSLVIVLSFAVGIAATSTIFSLASALFLRPVAGVTGAESIAVVHQREAASYPNYVDLRDENAVFSGIAAFSSRLASVNTGESSERRLLLLTSANYFEVLGVGAAAGRMFDSTDDAPGAAPVAVISNRFWRERFGADPDVVGRDIRVNGVPFTVIGVAAPGFGGSFTGFDVEVWATLGTAPAIATNLSLTDRGSGQLETVARLKPDVSLEEAEAGLEAFVDRQRAAFPDVNREYDVELSRLTGIDDALRGPTLALVGTLLSVSMVLLCIATFNAAGVLLARGVTRRREIAIRLALGAHRTSLVRLMLVESLLLAAMGGVLGLLLTVWATDVLKRFQPPLPVPISLDVQVDGRVLLFGVGLTLLVGIVGGLAPSFTLARGALAPILEDAGTRSAGRSTFRRLVIVSQIAGSTVLLVVAGLFLQTVTRALQTGPGFSTANVAVGPFIDLSFLPDHETRREAFVREATSRIEALPGVESMAIASTIPLGLFQGGTAEVFLSEPESMADGQGVEVLRNAVSARFFETLEIPILAGREFTSDDHGESPVVAVVSREMARRMWPDENAVGKAIWENGSMIRIVGVAADVRTQSLRETLQAVVYFSLAQRPSSRMNVIYRAKVPDASLDRRASEVLTSIEPDLPAITVVPLERHLEVALIAQRLAAAVTAVLGILGLSFAGVGLHAVIAFGVSQSIREIGTRIALGATSSRIVAGVVRDALLVAGIGLAIGIPLAIAGGILIESMLIGISPFDLVTLASVAALLLGIAVGGSLAPAMRASRVDPVEALRRQ